MGLRMSIMSTEQLPRPPIGTTEIRCERDCTALTLLNPHIRALGLPPVVDFPADVFESADGPPLTEVIHTAQHRPVPVWVNATGTGYTVLDPGPLNERTHPVVAVPLLVLQLALAGFAGWRAHVAVDSWAVYRKSNVRR